MPILMGFFRFSAKYAVPISNAGIGFSATTRFFWNSGLPHPNKNGKGLIVDHNLSMLMMPMIISGGSIGVILNIIVPETVVVIVFTLVVAFFSYSTGVSAYGIYQKENADLTEDK